MGIIPYNSPNIAFNYFRQKVHTPEKNAPGVCIFTQKGGRISCLKHPEKPQKQQKAQQYWTFYCIKD